MSQPRAAEPSTAFLLRHELRLWLRRVMELRGRGWLYAGIMLVAAVILHGIGAAVVRGLASVPSDVAPGLILPLLTMAAVMMLTLVTAQALSGSTRAFFENGASDLMLAAPVSPVRLFGVRAIALAITTTAPFALFALPVAHMGALLSGPRWLAIYPVLAAVGLVGTALGLVLALGLVRLLGARVSRSAGQITAVLIGTSLGFVIQQFNRLPTADKMDFVDRIVRASAKEADGWGVLVWTPGLALSGDPAAVILVAATAVVLFAVAVRATAGRYISARQEAAGLVEPARQRAHRRLRFASGPTAALRRKEWRLLTRDPWILMPVLQRAIALVPVCLTLSGFNARGDLVAAIAAPMLVVFAGKLAGGIAWLTLAAEEAPELVLTAPVPVPLIRRAKLDAALLACALLFALPIALLAWRSPEIAAWTALGCAAATLAATWLALAEPKSGRRRSLQDRFRNSVPFILAELFVTLALSGAVWLAVEHHFQAALVAALSAAIVLLVFMMLMRPAGAQGQGREIQPPSPRAGPQALSRNPS